VGGHDRPDRGVCFQSLVEANVPIGDDTDEYVILDYGQAAKAAGSHAPLGIGDGVLGSYGDWVWRHFGADQHESLLGLLPDSGGQERLPNFRVALAPKSSCLGKERILSARRKLRGKSGSLFHSSPRVFPKIEKQRL